MGFRLDRLDHEGIAAILKGDEMKAAIHDLAEAIAADVRDTTGTDVVVDDYTTDRAASSVTIRDADGLMLEVRDGVLTRAAAAHGLEVTSRTDG